MSDNIKDILTEGEGPFALPLIAKFVGMSVAAEKGIAVAQFEFEDGALIHVPMSDQICAALYAAMGVWNAKIAEQEAKDNTKH
ncbi:MAG: hypothetical protein Tsb0019_36500 [Roseibium sp.]